MIRKVSDSRDLISPGIAQEQRLDEADAACGDALPSLPNRAMRFVSFAADTATRPPNRSHRPATTTALLIRFLDVAAQVPPANRL